MAKVTSKLQVTLPKAIADRFHVRPGDEIDWQDAGEVIRVVPRKAKSTDRSPKMRLRLFDEATRRQGSREAARRRPRTRRGRGWTREELYRRGGAD